MDRSQQSSDKNSMPGMEEFLSSIINFTNTFQNETIALSERLGDKGGILVIQTSADTVRRQVGKLVDYVRNSAIGLNVAHREDVEVFMAHQDIAEYLNEASITMKKGLLDGLSGNLLEWISNVFHELKKIVLGLIEMILKWLGRKVPEWIVDLELFIDEVVDSILKLIEELSGGDGKAMAERLSQNMKNTLDEQAAKVRLQKALEGNRGNNED